MRSSLRPHCKIGSLLAAIGLCSILLAPIAAAGTLDDVERARQTDLRRQRGPARLLGKGQSRRLARLRRRFLQGGGRRRARRYQQGRLPGAVGGQPLRRAEGETDRPLGAQQLLDHVARPGGRARLRRHQLFRRPGFHAARAARRRRARCSSTAPPSASSPAPRRNRTRQAFFEKRKVKVSFLRFKERAAAREAYAAGKCDVFTGDRSALAAERARLAKPEDHVVLEGVISKEPLGPVTRKGDERLDRSRALDFVCADQRRGTGPRPDHGRHIDAAEGGRHGQAGGAGAGLGRTTGWSR